MPKGEINEIICIRRSPNSGKTATLKMLIDELQKKYPNAQLDNLGKRRLVEQQVVFLNIKELTVGVETRGDKAEDLSTNLQKLAAHPCDIIICACRPTPTPQSAVKDFAAQHSCTPVTIPKTIEQSPAQQTAINNADALNIIQIAGL